MIPNSSSEIDEYIGSFPAGTQKLLKQLRATIREIAPAAEEVISYQMPAFKLNGMLVWFAGCKNHIGFYPSASGISAFKVELSDYKSSKGSVRFPLDRPLPLELIRKIVQFRMHENLHKAQIRRKDERSK
jgi:uncharacterized protein YdhG (YjbR/CyaY superfamily)